MEPKSSPLESAPGGAPRQPEFQPVNPERQDQYSERAPEYGQERSRHEAEPMPQPIMPQPVTLPAPQPVADDTTTTQQSDSDSPQVAGDEDLIEKEWVDKAKKIISDTRDDPYRREQEVGKLQSDYLKKRYGKELGAS